MKTEIVLEIETPDYIELVDTDSLEVVTKEECIEYCRKWHKALVNHFKQTEIDNDDLMEFDEFYNENGDLPEYKATLK